MRNIIIYIMICQFSFHSSCLALVPSGLNRLAPVLPPIQKQNAFGSCRACPLTQAMFGMRGINLPKASLALKSPDSFVSERSLKPSSQCEALLLWTRKISHTRPKKIAVLYHKEYSLPDWDPSHRFVMSKFDDIMKEIDKDQGLKSAVRFVTPDSPASPELLELVHTPEYVRSFCEGTLDTASMRRIGLPWSPGLVRRTTLEVVSGCFDSPSINHPM
jgi:hypothetical protein